MEKSFKVFQYSRSIDNFLAHGCEVMSQPLQVEVFITITVYNSTCVWILYSEFSHHSIEYTNWSRVNIHKNSINFDLMNVEHGIYAMSKHSSHTREREREGERCDKMVNRFWNAATQMHWLFNMLNAKITQKMCVCENRIVHNCSCKKEITKFSSTRTLYERWSQNWFKRLILVCDGAKELKIQ